MRVDPIPQVLQIVRRRNDLLSQHLFEPVRIIEDTLVVCGARNETITFFKFYNCLPLQFFAFARFLFVRRFFDLLDDLQIVVTSVFVARNEQVFARIQFKQCIQQ